MLRYVIVLACFATPAFAQVKFPPAQRMTQPIPKYNVGEFQLGMSLGEVKALAEGMGLTIVGTTPTVPLSLPNSPARTEPFTTSVRYQGPATADGAKEQMIYVGFTSPRTGAVAYRLHRTVYYDEGKGPQDAALWNAAFQKWGNRPSQENQLQDSRTATWNFGSSGAQIGAPCDTAKTVIAPFAPVYSIQPEAIAPMMFLKQSGCSVKASFHVSYRGGKVMLFASNIFGMDVLHNAQMSDQAWFQAEAAKAQQTAPTAAPAGVPKL